MLTGPSIQGNSVDCLSTRKPFAELSVQERIKEFDERLGEVLFVVLIDSRRLRIYKTPLIVTMASPTSSCHPSMRIQSFVSTARLICFEVWLKASFVSAAMTTTPDKHSSNANSQAHNTFLKVTKYKRDTRKKRLQKPCVVISSRISSSTVQCQTKLPHTPAQTTRKSQI